MYEINNRNILLSWNEKSLTSSMNFNQNILSEDVQQLTVWLSI